eukprot:127951-Pleurochrysis_carterae.AAC.2
MKFQQYISVFLRAGLQHVASSRSPTRSSDPLKQCTAWNQVVSRSIWYVFRHLPSHQTPQRREPGRAGLSAAGRARAVERRP